MPLFATLGTDGVHAVVVGFWDFRKERPGAKLNE